MSEYDYFIVLDFEATCDDQHKISPQEVIELPSVLIDAQTLETVDEIQIYVKPLANPVLSEFCTELTGIQQSWVDEGVPFDLALIRYEEWLDSHGCLNGEKKCLFITCGDWDFGTMMKAQMDLLGLDVHDRYCQWTNIKHVYKRLYNIHAPGMAGMLNHLNIELTGHHHSGIDDCRNIAKIVVRVVQDGAVIDITSHKKKGKTAENSWVQVYNGKMTVGNMPSQKLMLGLKGNSKVQHFAAVICEEEGSKDFEELSSKYLTLCTTFPIDKAMTNETNLSDQFNTIITHLENGSNVYIFSNGFPRSGLLAYHLLRHSGLEHEQTLEQLDSISRGIRKNIDETSITYAQKIFN